MPAGTDTNALIAQAFLAVLGIGLVAWLLPRQVRTTRRLGGRLIAMGAVAAAVVLLGLSLQPAILPDNSGLLLTIMGVFIAFRPDSIVRLTGGPRPEWQALAEGTALQRAVARLGDRGSAADDPAIRAGLERLQAAGDPTTARYIELLEATLFSDPDGPAMAERLAALAVEEAALRGAVGPQPAFDHDPAPTAPRARSDDAPDA